MAPSLQIGFEAAKLLVAIVSAFFVAWFWNSTKDNFERYQYVDESYNAILKGTLKIPGSANLTPRTPTWVRSKTLMPSAITILR